MNINLDDQDLAELIEMVGMAKGKELVSTIFRGDKPTTRMLNLSQLEGKLIAARGDLARESGG